MAGPLFSSSMILSLSSLLVRWELEVLGTSPIYRLLLRESCITSNNHLKR